MGILESARIRLRAVYAAALAAKMRVAASTRYRAEVRRDIVSLFDVASYPVTPTGNLPFSARAQLVLIAQPLEPQTDLAAVHDYLCALIADAPVAELQELALRTNSAAILRRCHRYLPGCDRAHIWRTIQVAEVISA